MLNCWRKKNGAMAGFAQAVVASPMELAKLRVQLQDDSAAKTKSYKNPLDCIKKVYKTGGVPAIFRGLSLTVVRDLTGFAIYFAVYESITRYIQERRKDGELNAVDHLLAGGLAGSVSWTVNYPIDVVKTRFQSDPHRREISAKTCTAPSEQFSLPKEHCSRLSTSNPAAGHANPAADSTSRRFLSSTANNVINETASSSSKAASKQAFAQQQQSIPVEQHSNVSKISDERLSPKVSTASSNASNTTFRPSQNNQHQSQYGSIRDCVRKCYRQEGLRVFYQGLTPTILRAFPTNAVTFMTVAMVYKFARGNVSEEELLTR